MFEGIFGNKKEEERELNADILINLTNQSDKALYKVKKRVADDDLSRLAYKCIPAVVNQTKSDEEQIKQLTAEKSIIAVKGFYEVFGAGTWDADRKMILVMPPRIEDLPEEFKSGRKGTLFMPYIVTRKAELDILEAKRVGDRAGLDMARKSVSLLKDFYESFAEQQIKRINELADEKEEKAPQY